MNIEGDIKLDFSDVLIRPKRSTLESRSQVDLERQFTTRGGLKFSGVPIIASNMATGTFEMLNTLSQYKMFTAIAKHFNPKWFEVFSKEHGYMYSQNDVLDYGFYTIGMSKDELEELAGFTDYLKNGIGFRNDVKICVDIANGYTQKFASFIGRVRERFPSSVIVAGNVATPEMVQELVINGADFVKVGIGPGSQCETRKKTGVGYPQVSAALECADAAHGLNAGIVLDGGMRTPGDIAKAFCANSDMVMLGGMFAGTIEQAGEVITRKYETNELHPKTGKKIVVEKTFKTFYGMSSDYAQEKHFGGKKEYRTSEGSVEEVPFIGSATIVVEDILGGLRSCGTYIGATSIKNFGKCGTFVRVNRIHDKF